jgi:serine/threonine protein kinase
LLGALSYTAPEIFESGQYTMQSDIYSLGCILLDMITCDTLTVRDYLEKKDFCQNELFK